MGELAELADVAHGVERGVGDEELVGAKSVLATPVIESFCSV